jgi:hypothetical protein
MEAFIWEINGETAWGIYYENVLNENFVCGYVRVIRWRMEEEIRASLVIFDSFH